MGHVRIVAGVCLLLIQLVGARPVLGDGTDLFELPLDALIKIKVNRPATLTETPRDRIPAALTRINAAQIRQTSARSLNELLEIYVPGLQYINHRWGFSHLGARGIMSDRDEKYLLLVNGRTMNERTLVGAVTERDLNMLGDIHHIDIIRGPGSATYGVGAITMVIDIVTYDHQQFNGTELSYMTGIEGEKHQTLELKWGQSTTSQRGAFVYLGVSDFRGADSNDAPVRVSPTGRSVSLNAFEVDEDIEVDVANDKGQYRDIPKLKLHAQWQWDAWELWGRYTRGGEMKPPNARQISDGREDRFNELGSQQVTAMLRYQYVDPDDWEVQYKLSYDIVDYERALGNGNVVQSYREDEALAGVQINWELATNNSLAAGFEWSHEQFGLGSPGFPDEPSIIVGYSDNPNDWSTNTFSLYFEHQWRYSESVTTFLSGRFDENTYTDTLFSPRAALVYAPWEGDVFKWIVARSQRMNFAVDMRNEFLQNDIDDTEPEVLDSIEFRWQHTYDEWLSTAMSLYYEEIERIGFIVSAGPNNRSQGVLADEGQWGVEFEAGYETENLTIQFSHVYTELESFKLRNGVDSSFISAKPNGFGDSLTNWSHQLTKLYASLTIDQHWLVHGSLVYYWGFEGSKDRSAYLASIRPVPQRDTGDIYEGQAYLNLGAEYNTRDKLILGITGHNLLGLVDEDYNKRNYYLSDAGLYRIQAPSLTLYLNYAID